MILKIKLPIFLEFKMYMKNKGEELLEEHKFLSNTIKSVIEDLDFLDKTIDSIIERLEFFDYSADEIKFLDSRLFKNFMPLHVDLTDVIRGLISFEKIFIIEQFHAGNSFYNLLKEPLVVRLGDSLNNTIRKLDAFKLHLSLTITRFRLLERDIPKFVQEMIFMDNFECCISGLEGFYTVFDREISEFVALSDTLGKKISLFIDQVGKIDGVKWTVNETRFYNESYEFKK